MLRLRYERLRQGLSLQALAHLSNLHHPEVSLIESGRLTPTDEQLEALGAALRITPARVLLKPVTVVDPEEAVAAGR